MKKINPLVQWWVTPKLPYHDVYDIPLLINKSKASRFKFVISQWTINPLKRRLARVYLRFLQKFTDIKVIGITGSAGKTTTKEMLYSILKSTAKTVCTRTYIDPVYNIPNTILSVPFGTKYLILEMGVEYPGEMDYYLWLASPDIGIITNIFPTHLEYLGDVGGVFREKIKLAESLNKNGVAVLNTSDRQLLKVKGKLKSDIVWFGNGTSVMSALEKIKVDSSTFDLIFDQDRSKKIKIKLSVTGRQFISNALAASSAAWSLGVPLQKIKEGLENFSPAGHRMHITKTKDGVLLVDDTYNSNPKAAEAALMTFDDISYRMERVIVFGDMLELGNWDYKYHKEVGEMISKMTNINKVICIGKSSQVTAGVIAKKLGVGRVLTFDKADESIPSLKLLAKNKTAVFIKGSRSLGLDRLVNALS